MSHPVPHHALAAYAASQHHPWSTGVDKSGEGQAVARPSSLLTAFIMNLGTHLGHQYKIRCIHLQASHRSIFCTEEEYFCGVWLNSVVLNGEITVYL